MMGELRLIFFNLFFLKLYLKVRTIVLIMLFDKTDASANERILYNAKPNMILGCKKAILGVILLIIILSISPMIIQFIGQMQVYLISYVQLSLTRYAAIAFFVIILITVIYIIWQLIGWYSLEYTLTESRIIIKSGVFSTKKNYMPYASIQDVNTSQSFIAKIFNVGSVSAFSAYDNNQLELKDISNPSEVEEIIFSRMVGSRNFQTPPQRFQYQDSNQDEEYLGRNDYYDEYEPITPIAHENLSQRREYEYYPEDRPISNNSRHKYSYEPYDNGFNTPSNKYSQPNEEYREDFRSEREYHDSGNYYAEEPQQSAREVQSIEDGSEDVIQRHFDKFKK